VKREFLGDSYDMVKRLWADLLRKAAPLCADPVFFKDDDKDKEGALQREFTRLTGIPMEAGRPSGVFSILLDPNTGISLKDKRPRYVTTAYIAKRLGESGVRYVVTYDQSFGHGGPKALEAARQNERARLPEFLLRVSRVVPLRRWVTTGPAGAEDNHREGRSPIGANS